MKTLKRFFTRSSSFIYLVVCLAATGISSPVSAEIGHTGLYSGLIFSDSTEKYKEDGFDDVKENRGHIKAKLGKMLNQHISIEGQFGMTTNSDDKKGIATYGAYLRAEKDFGQYKLYGLLGASGIHAYFDGFDDVTESSGSYGVGMEIFGNKHIAVTFEYINMVDKSVGDGDLTFDTLGIGFSYYFIEDKSYFNKNRNKIRSIRY